MRKTITALLPCLFIFFSTKAQIRLGIAGGAHQASVIQQANNPGWDSMTSSPRTAYHLGVIVDIPFSPRSMFHLQTGGMYYEKGRTYDAVYDTTINTIHRINAKQFTNYVDIPLNLVMKLRLGKKTKMTFGGGPYISYFFGGSEKTETLYKTGYQQSQLNTELEVGKQPGQYQNFHYGANALFGFEFGRVLLTANYSRDMSDFYTPSNDEGSLQHQVVGGTVGVMLGKNKESANKAKDKDGDGIIDREDDCPSEAGGHDTKGCPDKDGDGIIDKKDKCPEVAGSSKYEGCLPPDLDNDGIDNSKDKCPEMAGVARYNGCPVPDSDLDGINDEVDKCPDVKGTMKYNGCAIPDTDKDGVNDEEDKCPTKIGLITNDGCPEIKKEIVKKVNTAARKLQFKFRSSELLPASQKVLNEVAKILKENPELKVAIEGHTSNSGNTSDNIILSQARADKVKKYLIAKGIAASRLKAKGYGPAKPLNTGKTEAQQALNRRVELKLSNK